MTNLGNLHITLSGDVEIAVEEHHLNLHSFNKLANTKYFQYPLTGCFGTR